MGTYPFTRQTVEALSALKSEPTWMRDLRLNAWDQVEKRLPDASFSPESIQAFNEPPKTSIPVKEWPSDLQHATDERGDEEGLIVRRDSTVLSRAISKEQAAHGVYFTDLDTALRQRPDLVKRYFGQQIKGETLETSLNTAFWSGGSFLYVPANVAVHLPFHTCYWVSTMNMGLFPRTIIVAERGSVVSFIDELISPSWNNPGLSSACTELYVADQAKAYYITIQNLASSIHHSHHVESQLEGCGKLTSFALLLGANVSRNTIGLELKESTLAKETPTRRTFDLKTADIEAVPSYLENNLNQLPTGALREKLRHTVIGKLTGQRPTLTLEKVAELHPEVRL